MDLLVGPPTVLCSGDGWLVVDKPSGIFVHRSSLDASARDVMVTRVRDLLGAPVFPVHRLDRPTSGCLLFALSPEATRRCQAALQEAHKTYLALVRGTAERLPARVDRPLRPPDKVDEVAASTSFEVLAR